jgi:Response regulator containing a CheY-like receiver domain and an HTH DNA-binding domain
MNNHNDKYDELNKNSELDSPFQIKVLIADDHDLIRQGLKSIISYENDLVVAGEAENGEEVFRTLELYKPDVLLMDINMPLMSGIEVLKALKAQDNPVKVLLLTVESDKKTILEAIEIGADGYILKGSSTEELIEGIRRVYNDENYIDKSLVTLLFMRVTQSEPESKLLKELSSRDLEILMYISKGLSNKEIGNQMFLSEKTIKNNATRIFKILEVRDRVQATIYAIENRVEELYLKNNQ